MQSNIRRRPRRIIAAAAAALLLAFAAGLSAHDFWLVPTVFHLAPGATLVVQGQTSSRFPTSEGAVAAERVADARLLGARSETPIRDLATSGKSLMLRHRPDAAGQQVVAVSLQPRSVRESAAGFRRYLELEGAPELLERYGREGRLPTDSITRRYAKYAKALVQVGEGGPTAYSRVAGYPLEFVPLEDPATVPVGGVLPVQVLFDGQPLPGAKVHTGAAPMGPDITPERAAAAASDVALTSDADGVVRVPVSRAGVWNVRGLHIAPAAPGSGADWDTHWASLVFAVGPTKSERVRGMPVTKP